MKIRAYSTKELLVYYNVSRKTFLKWLQPYLEDIGPRIGYYYSAHQVALIVEKIGWP